jgi:hypothetical protein
MRQLSGKINIYIAKLSLLAFYFQTAKKRDFKKIPVIHHQPIAFEN